MERRAVHVERVRGVKGEACGPDTLPTHGQWRFQGWYRVSPQLKSHGNYRNGGPFQRECNPSTLRRLRTFVDEDQFDQRTQRDVERVGAVAERFVAVGHGRFVAHDADGHVLQLAEQRRRRHPQTDVVDLRRVEPVVLLNWFIE